MPGNRVATIRRSYLLLCLLGEMLHSTATQAQISDDRVSQIVKSVGTTALEESRLVGLSVGVATADRTVCVVSFGSANAEHDIPVADNTVFRIGSVSKTFTAAAVLILVEEGKVQLDNPLSIYLPDYPLPGANATVRQLLQHTSGIADLTRQPTFRKNRQVDLSRQEVLDSFKDLPLEFTPGLRHRYCNSGYLLLAQIVEAAAEEPFEEFIEKRLLRPAGLTQTIIDNQDAVVRHRASGYSRWGGSIRNAPHVSPKISTGAGNMAATVADLLRWKQALITGEIISATSFEQMTTQGRLGNGRPFQYGLGVFVQTIGGEKVVRHGGGISGFRSDLAWYTKSGYIIAVLANSDNAKPDGISQRVFRKIASESAAGE